MFNEEELEKVKQKALEDHVPIVMDDSLEVIKEILIKENPKRILLLPALPDKPVSKTPCPLYRDNASTDAYKATLHPLPSRMPAPRYPELPYPPKYRYYDAPQIRNSRTLLPLSSDRSAAYVPDAQTKANGTLPDYSFRPASNSFLY